jgi:hypothetical protein
MRSSTTAWSCRVVSAPLKLWVMFKLRAVDVYRQAIAANVAFCA